MPGPAIKHPADYSPWAAATAQLAPIDSPSFGRVNLGASFVIYLLSETSRVLRGHAT
jgi:hypothetical protein